MGCRGSSSQETPGAGRVVSKDALKHVADGQQPQTEAMKEASRAVEASASFRGDEAAGQMTAFQGEIVTFL
ncbi:MAG: hypothetical protein ACM3X2_03255, partial [Pseudomonadota bacterium]